jgi:hypothetical protein
MAASAKLNEHPRSELQTALLAPANGARPAVGLYRRTLGRRARSGHAGTGERQLLDEGALDESTPWALQNLVAALFRLEKSHGPQPLQAALSALIDWLDAPEQASLRRAFTVWVKRVLLPGRLPGVHLPEVGDLLEIKSMLAESVIEWTEEWKRQGIQEGIRQGREKGWQEGRQEGEVILLERLLIKRFGPLSDDTRARLQSASHAQLEDWAERILDARRLSEVFGDG